MEMGGERKCKREGGEEMEEDGKGKGGALGALRGKRGQIKGLQ